MVTGTLVMTCVPKVEVEGPASECAMHQRVIGTLLGKCLDQTRCGALQTFSEIDLLPCTLRVIVEPIGASTASPVALSAPKPKLKLPTTLITAGVVDQNSAVYHDAADATPQTDVSGTTADEVPKLQRKARNHGQVSQLEN